MPPEVPGVAQFELQRKLTPGIALTCFIDHRLATINAHRATIRNNQSCQLAEVVSAAAPYV